MANKKKNDKNKDNVVDPTIPVVNLPPVDVFGSKDTETDFYLNIISGKLVL